MEQQDWPEFIKKYGDDIILEGYGKFEQLARNYRQGIENLNHVKGKQDAEFSIHNKTFRTNKKYDADTPLKNFIDDCEQQAKAIAKECGFIERPTVEENETVKNENEKSDNLETPSLDLDKKQEDILKKIEKFNVLTIEETSKRNVLPDPSLGVIKQKEHEDQLKEDKRVQRLAELRAAQEQMFTKERER